MKLCFLLSKTLWMNLNVLELLIEYDIFLRMVLRKRYRSAICTQASKLASTSLADGH